MNKRRLFSLLLALQLLASLAAGSAAAALLDVGPVVPEVNPSSAPTLGHGFPLWYRDTNRVPLQLCTDRDSGMCLTAEPFPLLPQRFPDNMGDELFWWAGDAAMTVPQQGALDRDGGALLVMAIEAAFSTGNVVPGAQVSFARMRIRIDTPYAGEYLVTTPYKQFTFNVAADVVGDGINFTEDIGLAEGGVFTGALKGSIGPFLYCTNAPIVVNGKSYLGNPGNECTVRGSVFPSPENPTNYFRVQGPNGLDLRTDLFTIMGQLYTDPIPTPLTVDRVSYSRDSSGVRVSAFATTQPLSNQSMPTAAFPGNFALTGTPSTLEVTAPGIPAIATATNSPADGKFFGQSRLFADPGLLPATVQVTNTADTPQTVREAPLVDDVVIDTAVFTPADRKLVVRARSHDSVANPVLSLFFPGMESPVGTVDGYLTVAFPFTDSTVTPARTYQIPPEKISVVSSLGGSDSSAVTGIFPTAALPTGSIAINGGAAFTKSAAATLTLPASSANGPVTKMQFSKDGTTYFQLEPYAATRLVTLLPGEGVRTMYVRYADAAGRLSPPFSDSITVDSTPPSGSVTINGGAHTTGSTSVTVNSSATDLNGVATMQLSNDGINWLAPVPYADSATLNLLPGDGVKTVLARFIDHAGNISPTVSASILLNSTAPTGSVAINGGATHTNSLNAALTLSATSPAGSVTQMQFSKDGLKYFGFEPYATTRNVTLLAGEGLRTIHVRYKDSANAVSAPVSAGIIVDTTKPVGTIAFTTPDPTSSDTGTLALTATDASGVLEMQFSRDGVNYSPLEPFAATRTVALNPGLNSFTVRFKDRAGNLSLPVTSSITRN